MTSHSAPSLAAATLEGERRSSIPPLDQARLGARVRQQWLVAGRLVVATLLLVGALVWGEGSGSSRTSELSWVIAAVFASSLAFAVVLARGGSLDRRSLDRLASVQIAIDLMTTSTLVWLAGGAVSGLSFLYGTVVLAAATVLGPRGTVLTTGATIVLYLVIGVGSSQIGHFVPSNGPSAVPPAEVSIALFRNVVGLVLVGALASLLSDRLWRTDRELVRATESAAGYARLTEDIVRSVSSGLLTAGLDGRVRSVNPAGAEILRARAEDVVGRPLSEILPVGERPAPTDRRERGEGLATRLDGSAFPAGFTRAPLISAAGEVQGSLVVFTDLTEVTELREQATRAERLASLGRLAAGLAHEIRNPLGSIAGSVELVRDAGALGEEDRHLLGVVLKEVHRLNDLVGAMLDVSRPIVPERERVDVAEITREIVQQAERGTAAELGVALVLDASEAVVAAVDPSQLRQVLWNLIKNALQLSPRGETVRVRVWRVRDEARIAVEDRGPGIAAADRPHLFEMFFSRRKHGVGLGLALVKQIVDAHRGRIEVESEPGKGARFVVRLPILAGSDAAQAEMSRRGESPASSSDDRGAQRT